MSNPLEDTGPKQVTTTSIILVLAAVFVLLRFWARLHVVANYGSDDWLIVAALVSVFLLGGLNFGMVHRGMGQHASTLSQGRMEDMLKLLLAFEFMYVTAVALVKMSLLAMYIRIFPIRGFLIGAWVIGGCVMSWWFAMLFVCIFQCIPVRLAWEPWEPGRCINLKAGFIGNAVPNIVTDVAILVMPARQVWLLNATVAQKISLICTFGLGSFVLVASIYRFSTIMQFHTDDTSFTLATSCTWCVVECGCGVICACLPTLRPLVKKLSSQFHTKPERSKDASKATGRPAELVTIGGSGGAATHPGKFSQEGAAAKNPFHKLDEGPELDWV